MLVFKGLSSISEAPDSEALTSCALTMNGHIESYPIKVSCHFSPTGNLPFPSTPKYLIGIQRCGAWQHNKLTASQKTIMVGQLDLFLSPIPGSGFETDHGCCHPQILEEIGTSASCKLEKNLEIHQPGQLGKSKNGLGLL